MDARPGPTQTGTRHRRAVASAQARALFAAALVTALLSALTVIRPAEAGAAQTVSTHQVTVRVPARASAVDTGVYLEAGEPFVISAAGEWTLVTDRKQYVADADGAAYCVYEGRRLGVLLGRVAGLPGPAQFALGTRAESRAPASGVLYLMSNHPWWLRDRQQGELTVTVRGGRAATPELRSNSEEAELRAARAAVLQRLNAVRQRMGLPAVDVVAALERAAQGHAKYADRHDYSHQERPDRAGFVGEYPWDRARAFGYVGGCGEVMAMEEGAEAALEMWLASVYHRQFITHPALSGIGFGLYGRVQVLNYALAAAPLTERVAAYPPPDAQEVPLSWPGLELPSPIPEGAPTPVGYTVSAHFPAVVKAVHALRLEDPHRGVVGCYARHRLSDAALSNSDAVFLLPRAPLQPGTTYRVSMAVETARGPQEIAWSFTTSAEAEGARESAVLGPPSLTTMAADVRQGLLGPLAWLVGLTFGRGAVPT